MSGMNSGGYGRDALRGKGQGLLSPESLRGVRTVLLKAFLCMFSSVSLILVQIYLILAKTFDY